MRGRVARAAPVRGRGPGPARGVGPRGRADRRRKRYARPEGGLTGRRRSLSWHGALGLWAAVGLLGLSATGLTWSTYAGDNIDQLRTSLSWTTPTLATGTGGGDHSAHEGHEGHDRTATPAATPVGVDQVMATATTAGIDGPVELVPPRAAGKAFAVKEIDKQWPVRLDQVAVDPTDGKVSSELRFADYPLGAKLTRFGIDLHQGLAPRHRPRREGAPQVLEHVNFLTPFHGQDPASILPRAAAYRSCSAGLPRPHPGGSGDRVSRIVLWAGRTRQGALACGGCPGTRAHAFGW